MNCCDAPVSCQCNTEMTSWRRGIFFVPQNPHHPVNLHPHNTHTKLTTEFTMGKAAKKVKKSDARKAADPVGARPKKPAFQATPQTDALHKSKILPTVKSLAAASATDRASALLTCTELLRDDTCRFLLLKERIVAKLMEDLVHDSSEDVVVLAWSALCRIAREEGYDQSVYMFRRDILSRIKTLLEKVWDSHSSSHLFAVCTK
jgi:hypothetical protein